MSGCNEYHEKLVKIVDATKTITKIINKIIDDEEIVGKTVKLMKNIPRFPGEIEVCREVDVKIRKPRWGDVDEYNIRKICMRIKNNIYINMELKVDDIAYDSISLVTMSLKDLYILIQLADEIEKLVDELEKKIGDYRKEVEKIKKIKTLLKLLGEHIS